ncbi:hypothetical protein [Methanoculleus sp.]
MQTIDVPGIEHVYGFQRDSASSGYRITMLNQGSPRSGARSPGSKSC